MNKLLEHLLNDDLISFTEEVKSTLNEKAKEELKAAKPKAYTDDWAPSSINKRSLFYHLHKQNAMGNRDHPKVKEADRIASHIFFAGPPIKGPKNGN